MGVSDALYRESVVNLASSSHEIQELGPSLSASPRMGERVRIADDDQAIPCSGQKDIDALWRTHESDIVTGVPSSE